MTECRHGIAADRLSLTSRNRLNPTASAVRIREAQNMTLLADLLSADPKKVSSACQSLRALRDRTILAPLTEQLDAIRNQARALAQQPAPDERIAALEFALHKLEHVQKSKACMCALYLTDDLFDPREEARQGHIRILDTIYTADSLDHYECVCEDCGARFQVEENSYLRTWWAWRVDRHPIAAQRPSQAMHAHYG